MKVNIKSGSITINGNTYVGRNISIVNGVVTIDGAEQDDKVQGEVNVTINGDVERLENVSGKVIARNVQSISTQSGDVECGGVSGSIKTMSGDVKCGNVGGSIKTMSGDVFHG